MKKTEYLSASLILISFIIGIAIYPAMPSLMASHWDISGNVNGYMPKLIVLFLLPFISILLFAFFLIIPIIDPLKKNIAKFREYYDYFVLILIAFLLYIYLLTIFWNLGFVFNMNVMFLPAFSAIFYFIGILMEKAKRNWFIGIRTPWTLSSDTVWAKTHAIGSLLFKISAVISLLGIFFRVYAILFLIVPVFFSAIYSVVYSYFEYQREYGKRNRRK